MDKRATPEKRIKKRYRDHTGDKGMPPTGSQRHKAKSIARGEEQDAHAPIAHYPMTPLRGLFADIGCGNIDVTTEVRK